MKKIIILFFTLCPFIAIAQSPLLNDIVRVNPLSQARIANALDAIKPHAATGTNTYTVAFVGAYTSYSTGDVLKLTFANSNTSTTCSVNVNSIAVKALKDVEGNDLAVGALKAGGTYMFVYNGTNFRMLGGSGGGGGDFWELSGESILTDDTEITGQGIKNLHFGNALYDPAKMMKDLTFQARELFDMFLDVDGDGNAEGEVFIGSSVLSIHHDDRIELNVPSGGLTLNNAAPGSPSTQYLRGDMTWATPSGSGATAAGATGNVQYKSAGGGLQAEAALTYDSATNILLVDNVRPSANDAGALGSASLKWADLFLADGAVINFNNGDVTATHSSNAVTIAGGDLFVPAEAYGSGWDSDNSTPTKNDVYDKIQTITAVDYTRQAVSVSAGTLTLDMNSATLRNFDLTSTQSSAFTIAFSNTTNMVEAKLTLRLTGSVAITLPSTVEMQNYETINARWNTSTQVLTLVGSTATRFLMTFYYDGSVILTQASDNFE